jgi:hypothetical protein
MENSPQIDDQTKGNAQPDSVGRHQSGGPDEPKVYRVPLWAKVALVFCVLLFLAFFYSFMAQVSNGPD